jgi:hypothetical protein
MLIAVGAVLIALEGLYLVVAGPTTSYFGSLATGGTFVVSTTALGVLAVLAGLSGSGLAAMVSARPDHHTFVGGASLTIALLSLFAGGGFLLGAALLYVGGCLALYYRPAPALSPQEDAPDDVLDEDPVVEADMIATRTRSR